MEGSGGHGEVHGGEHGEDNGRQQSGADHVEEFQLDWNERSHDPEFKTGY